METKKDESSGKRHEKVAFVNPNFARHCGLKITPALREYYRYTDVSAEVERQGLGSNRPDPIRLHHDRRGEAETAQDENIRREPKSESKAKTRKN